MITVMLVPVSTPSRLRNQMAKKNPPPIMPGARALANSQSMMTTNARHQVSLRPVRWRMRAMYIQSRITKLPNASSIQKEVPRVQEIDCSAPRSAVRQISSAVMPRPMATGASILGRLKFFSSAASSLTMARSNCRK